MSDAEIEMYRARFLAEQELGGEGAEAETILVVTSEDIYYSPVYDWAFEELGEGDRGRGPDQD